MKYIRTETGKYEVTNNKFGIIEENGKFKKFCENMGHTWYSELEVVKQSDKLEKLCDGFYNDILGEGAFNFDPLYLYVDFEDFSDDYIGYRVHDDWTGNGYGFIKTNKGLIFVAKMNDDEVLELI